MKPSNKPNKKKIRGSSSGKSQADFYYKIYREVSPYMGIGGIFVASMGLFLGLGTFLDKRWETFPWMSLVGAVLGITVGFYQFFKIVLRSPDKSRDNKKER